MRLNEDGTLSIVHMSFSEAEPLAFCIDMEGEIVKRLPVSKNMIVQNFDGEIFSYQNGGEFDFFHTANDTLWTYNNTENRLEARFAMHFPDPTTSRSTSISIYLKVSSPIVTIGMSLQTNQEKVVPTSSTARPEKDKSST